MLSPYESVSPSCFWRNGVQNCDPASMVDIYSRKFSIESTDVIATAGSCFAQHIARHMRRSGYTVLDVEPCPPGLSGSSAEHFGYGLYSARYGNIYTARQLLQLLQEAQGSRKPSNIVWKKGSRFVDALRPGIEPDGLDSPEEVIAHRQYHIYLLKGMLRKNSIFIFTLGLTEAWVHNESGTVYPTAPGTIAGDFDPTIYKFKNFTVDEILSDMREAIEIIKEFNPDVKFILTVSPVPLTATATEQHVLRATIYSKSVLRVVAETLSAASDSVDYFPSFEIIMNPASRGRFFSPNLRSVTAEGVESVMKVFFAAHNAKISFPVNERSGEVQQNSITVEDSDAVICEEMLLEAFAGEKQ